MPDRAERLRQEHASQHHRRSGDADRRRGSGQRQSCARADPQGDCLRVPGEHVVPVEHDPRQRHGWTGISGRPAGGATRARHGGYRGRWAHRLRQQLSASALGRHEAARFAGARAQLAHRHSVDGRAVRGARRTDPHLSGRGTLGSACHHQQDHRARDPQFVGSRIPGRSRGGDDGAAGRDQGHHRGQGCASARAELYDLIGVFRSAQRPLRAVARRDRKDRRRLRRQGGGARSRAARSRGPARQRPGSPR